MIRGRTFAETFALHLKISNAKYTTHGNKTCHKLSLTSNLEDLKTKIWRTKSRGISSGV